MIVLCLCLVGCKFEGNQFGCNYFEENGVEFFMFEEFEMVFILLLVGMFNLFIFYVIVILYSK